MKLTRPQEGDFSDQTLGGNFSTANPETYMTTPTFLYSSPHSACLTIKLPDYSQVREGGFFWTLVCHLP